MTKKQEMVIKALADGLSDKEACALAGINEKSIYRMKKDTQFNVTLAMCCIDRLQGLLPKAISKLDEIISNEDTAYYQQQIQAIKMILEYSHINAMMDTEDKNLAVTVRYE